MYIALEGIDSAGKSTQLTLLAQHYPEALITREPGATPLGATIRDRVLHDYTLSPRGRFFLFLADRAEHIEQIIKPNIHRLIISDRSLISGIAYAPIEIDLDEAIRLNLLATDHFVPNRVILLKLTAHELRKRLAAKQQDAIEAQGVEALLAIQERLEEVCRRLGIDLFLIDAARPIEEIFSEIQRSIHD